MIFDDDDDDDIDLERENLGKFNNRFNEWKLDFEWMELRISESKTLYEFGGRYHEVDWMWSVKTKKSDVTGEVESYKYLISFMRWDRALW